MLVAWSCYSAKTLQAQTPCSWHALDNCKSVVKAIAIETNAPGVRVAIRTYRHESTGRRIIDGVTSLKDRTIASATVFERPDFIESRQVGYVVKPPSLASPSQVCLSLEGGSYVVVVVAVTSRRLSSRVR